MNLDFYDWYNITKSMDKFNSFKKIERKRNTHSILKPKSYVRKKKSQHIRSNC